MSKKGVEILVVPSAFTAETGAAHWELLLRARAVENLCYVIAPNQGGFHLNGRKTFGHSMIVDPWGVVLDCYKTGGGLCFGRNRSGTAGKSAGGISGFKPSAFFL